MSDTCLCQAHLSLLLKNLRMFHVILFNQITSMSPFRCGRRSFRWSTGKNACLLWKKFLEMIQALMVILL
uniref:Uncharacterized protein n=1 Tax=Arundo donax TaxID=35708 RepID=A0A0A9DF24_ARUDO